MYNMAISMKKIKFVKLNKLLILKLGRWVNQVFDGSFRAIIFIHFRGFCYHLLSSSAMDLLNPENLCGQTLLRIVSRGSAIIAEELRLADNIPEVFVEADKIQDPSQLKYQAILFDCEYLRDPEAYENKINESQDLIELDQEFQDNHAGMIIFTFLNIYSYSYF